MGGVLQIASHALITPMALFAIAVRIEQRLTKIETDVTWLKMNMKSGCERKGENEGDR